MALVRVFIPIFNHATFLNDRFESVANQSLKDIRVTLFDDGSTDGWQSVVRPDNFFKSYDISSSIVSSGSPYSQWQKVVGESVEEFIWIAESDDAADLNFLELAVALFREKDVDFVVCESQAFDAESNLLTPNHFFHNFTEATALSGRDFIRSFLLHSNKVLNVSSVLFRRKSLEKQLKAVKDFKYLGDWYVYLKVALNGCVGLIPSILNYHRIHVGTTRARPRSFADNAQILFERCRILEVLKVNELVTQSEYERQVVDIARRCLLEVDLEDRVIRALKAFRPNFRRVVIWGVGGIGHRVLVAIQENKVNVDTEIVLVDEKFTCGTSNGHSRHRLMTPSDYLKNVGEDDVIVVCTVEAEGGILRTLKEAKPDHTMTISLSALPID